MLIAKTYNRFWLFQFIKIRVINLNKKELRTTVRSSLLSLSPEIHKIKSDMIHNKLINMEEIKNATIIGITIANFPEVGTERLIATLRKQGKKIAIPRCNPKTKEMSFYIYESDEQLETVYMDLKEPIPSVTTIVQSSEIDVMITPGIVFDPTGFRIGYGGGYYDRYLTNFEKPTISMAFEVQIVEKVPADAYDLPICKLITEERIINCKKLREEEMI